MEASLQKQPQIKILSVNERLRLGEAEIEEIIKTVQVALPRYVDGDIDLAITILERNLKIMTDMALMKEAITHLVRNAMPDCSTFPLTINQVHFGIESLLKGNDSIIGACAFISPAAVGTYICVDEKMKEKILQPFFTTKKEDNGLDLAMAYRVIKQFHGEIKVKNRVGPAKEANIYLPLTRLEIVSMMSMTAT